MNNQEIKDVVKLITIFCLTILIVILGTAVFMEMAAQNAYVYSISKDGLTTEKQIRVDIKSENEVHFWTSNKNIEIFIRVGKGFDGADIWRDAGNKNIKCVVKDNLRIFAVSDKKAFYYITTKK